MEASAEKSLSSRVEQALDTIRPYLLADGGDVRVAGITADRKVLVEFTGNCADCTLSSMTFRAGVEEAVLRLVPEITGVEQINRTI